MRRTGFSAFAAVMLVGLIAVGGAAAASAQEATPVADADHPLVGAWALDTDVDDPENPLTLAVFSADGVYFQVVAGDDPSAGSQVGVGVWESTGGSTANMTFWILAGGDTMVIIRAELEVEPGGLELGGSWTIELIDAEGTGTGQIGPGFVEGSKLIVEPQGVPIGSFEDIFGGLEATPEG
jgi:hypothetical protein